MENNIHSCIIGIRLQQPWQQVGTALRMETRSKKISKRAAVFMSRLDAMVFFCAAGIKSFQEEDLDRIISYITYYIYMCVCLYIYMHIHYICIHIMCIHIMCIHIMLTWHHMTILSGPILPDSPRFCGLPRLADILDAKLHLTTLWSVKKNLRTGSSGNFTCKNQDVYTYIYICICRCMYVVI